VLDGAAEIGKSLGIGRKPRVEYAGTIYHVTNRSDRREAIFHADFEQKTV
jgi:hypothetical protein